MTHRASPEFWKLYWKLPAEVRSRANGAFEKLKNDPYHPSLHFKKVGSRWSVRVDLGYRALADERPDGLLWGWIGTHDEYRLQIRRGSAQDT